MNRWVTWAVRKIGGKKEESSGSHLFATHFFVSKNSELPPQDRAGEEEERAQETSVLSGEFRLRVEVPFYDATVRVPLNAADPLATAASNARREIGLSAHARHQMNPFDPNRPIWKPIENSHHSVLLETPWRG